MVPSLIITTWQVSLASATNQNSKKTLGPGSKNYYPRANFDGKEASKYDIILDY